MHIVQKPLGSFLISREANISPNDLRFNHPPPKTLDESFHIPMKTNFVSADQFENLVRISMRDDTTKIEVISSDQFILEDAKATRIPYYKLNLHSNLGEEMQDILPSELAKALEKLGLPQIESHYDNTTGEQEIDGQRFAYESRTTENGFIFTITRE